LEDARKRGGGSKGCVQGNQLGNPAWVLQSPS